MNKESKFQNIIIVMLLITVITMSVGFAVAAYTQDLDIDGDVTAKAAIWEVAFDTSSYTENTSTGYVTSKTHSVTGTSVNFTVDLEVGQKFAFEVNAANTGTLDAYLSSVSLTSLTEAESKYLSYTVKVNGTTYSADSTNLNVPLIADATHKVEVEVSYNLPTSATDLPSVDKTTSLSVSLNYASVLEQ